MKIAMLTSGGDCQGLNATMRGVAKTLYNEFNDLTIYGILDGYKGLIECNYKELKKEDFSGILTLGGTILGTSRQPFKKMQVIEENGVDKVKAMIDTYNKLELDCLVILGGNGTHKTANLLREKGLNVVTLPKTIDNDLWGTDVTFGFHSAVDVATDVIDRIHTTATSHGRIFVVEIMGHKAGWLTLYAGIAGGADIILIPEIPYDINKMKEEIEKRTADNKGFSIIAVAEGAISVEESKMSKKEFKTARENMKQSSIAYRVADEIMEITNHEVRVAVPGHVQRGGAPNPYDRVLCTRFGAFAAELIKNKNFGNMVGMKNDEVVAVPLSEVAGKLKNVPKDDQLIAAARKIGISFGD
ncbi:MAG: ATP-dependent 6-phosphofructokinase [Lachnospirales bacterium]